MGLISPAVVSPPATPVPKACLLDLDGTLLDTLHDIAHAVNSGLELLGLSPLPADDYRYKVGEGVPALCQRTIGDSHPHLVGRLAELARAIYRAELIRHTRPYPGVEALVRRLRGAGVRLGVLSNKPHDMTCRIIDAFWPDGAFAFVQGYVDHATRKPNPFFIDRFCRTLDVDAAEIWVIGDTPTDVEAARRAGAPCIAVTWGFRSRADLLASSPWRIVDRPEDIL
ncbi:MAG: Phosphoglycolate phosphatase [Phycisphaerae bacterium]|nr:Phosphoglycolate phosphatase [Phycisphaerae bacterium]